MSANREQYIIELVDKGVRKGLQGISKDVNQLRGGIDRLSGGIGKKGGSSGLMGSLGGLSRFVGVGAVVAGVGMLTKNIITSGIEMERTRVSFETFTGSAAKGNELIKKMNEFANVTPFDNKKVLESAKTLMAFGVEADNIQPTLRLIGNISSGTGKDLKELAVIFGQVKSTGRLMGQDLLQLVNAGFNPLQEINRTTGRSMRDLKKDMSKGLISFDDVTKAFQTATSEGGRFNNMMEKQSKTAGGRWSTLMGKMQMIGISLGESILPAISVVIGGLLKVIDVVSKNAEVFKTLGIIIGIAALAWVAYNIPIAIAAIQTGVMTGAMWALSAAMMVNPVGLVVAGIVALVAVLVIAWRHSETFRAAMYALWEVMKGVGKAVWDLLVEPLSALKDIWDGLSDLFSGKGTDKLESGIKRLGKSILNYVMQPLLGLTKIVDAIFGTDATASIEKFTGTKSIFSDVEKDAKKGAQQSRIIDHFANGGLGADFADDKKNGIKSITKGIPGSGSVTKNGLKSGISEVKAGAPKTFNINIESLIKEQNFETIKDMGSMKNIIRDEVSRLLLGVVNDVQTT